MRKYTAFRASVGGINMSLADMVTGKKKLCAEDIEFVVNIDTAKDYMFMNYLEQEIIKQHGQQFLVQSTDKVQYIMGFVLNKDFSGLFEMYNSCLKIYMDSCNNDINCLDGFNIVFLVLVHVTMKIIRKNKNRLEA
jgi:hypothetical protein